MACASTGDTSAALAAYCAAAGIPSVVLLPRGKISTAQLVQPIANGALVLELDTDFDGCMRVVKELSETKDIYLANSMNSLRIEGQKTASIEIAQQLGWRSPDWIVIPGGNLGNASAVGKGFLLMKELGLVDRLPRLVVAQAEAANPLWRSTTGAGKRPTAAVEVAPVQARKTLATPSRSAPRSRPAAPCGRSRPSTGSSSRRASRSWRTPGRAPIGPGSSPARTPAWRWRRWRSLSARGVVKRGERVVVVSTAHGLKFSDFKTGYHDGTLPGLESPLRNPGVKLPATLGSVQDAIAARFGKAKREIGS